ncbi:MAG: M48 family metalloprotease [Chlamydiales bacterium]
MTPLFSNSKPSSASQFTLEPTYCEQLASAVSNVVQFIFAPFTTLYDWIRPINVVTGQREFHIIPSFVEKFIGTSAYSSLVAASGGEILEDNSKYAFYVRTLREVGADLVAACPRKDLEFEFKLINSPQDNAWCLPGGKIGVNLGLMRNIQKAESGSIHFREKVAAVLSHEITHAAARHGGRKIELQLFLFTVLQTIKYAFVYLFIGRAYDEEIQRAGNNRIASAKAHLRREEAIRNSLAWLNPIGDWLIAGVGLCGSRSHELEADKYGMHLMARACIDLKAAVWLMSYFERKHSHSTGNGWLDWLASWFYSHPTPAERLAANRNTLQELGG